MNSQIRIETLGCRLNQIESESIARFFIDNGFSVCMEAVTSQTEEDSSILISIINTCAVTQKAEQKARRIIRLYLKKFPKSTIIVTGCYAQLSSLKIAEIDKRICVIGGQIKSRIAEVPLLLKDFLNKGEFNGTDFSAFVTEGLTKTEPEKAGFPENSFKLATTSFLAHSRASLKIQDGCNCNCAFCTIHIARGHSVSLDVQTAVERVLELEKSGQSEVVITTVNIGQYKSEYNGEVYNFSKLLKLLLEKTNTINFRISSLYPEIVDDEFCDVIKNERVCPHFHISVQSGSDKILQAMNRNYTSSQILNACLMLKAAKKDPFLACDIITGFPGETKDDFTRTVELLEGAGFAWVHAFPFSSRPGTAASVMKNQVPQSISGERAKRITDWAINSKINYINKFRGQKLYGVLETVKKSPVLLNNKDYIYHVVTDNFIHCELHSNKILETNKKIQILIEKPLPEKIIKGGEIEALASLL